MGCCFYSLCRQWQSSLHPVSSTGSRSTVFQREKFHWNSKIVLVQGAMLITPLVLAVAMAG